MEPSSYYLIIFLWNFISPCCAMLPLAVIRNPFSKTELKLISSPKPVVKPVNLKKYIRDFPPWYMPSKQPSQKLILPVLQTPRSVYQHLWRTGISRKDLQLAKNISKHKEDPTPTDDAIHMLNAESLFTIKPNERLTLWIDSEPTLKAEEITSTEFVTPSTEEYTTPSTEAYRLPFNNMDHPINTARHYLLSARDYKTLKDFIRELSNALNIIRKSSLNQY